MQPVPLPHAQLGAALPPHPLVSGPPAFVALPPSPPRHLQPQYVHPPPSPPHHHHHQQQQHPYPQHQQPHQQPDGRVVRIGPREVLLRDVSVQVTAADVERLLSRFGILHSIHFLPLVSNDAPASDCVVTFVDVSAAAAAVAAAAHGDGALGAPS
jgi:hypothetical protein